MLINHTPDVFIDFAGRQFSKRLDAISRATAAG